MFRLKGVQFYQKQIFLEGFFGLIKAKKQLGHGFTEIRFGNRGTKGTNLIDRLVFHKG